MGVQGTSNALLSWVNYSVHWVNLLGAIFLLYPTCIFIFIICLPYVSSSWAILESSIEGNGLPFIYLLKTLMVIMPVTLGLQGVAEMLGSILVLLGHSQQQATDAKQIV